jgi:oligopeptide/dipeptide ABC transporter ATP-binding protein
MEIAAAEAIFDDPLHPYTELLIASVPTIEEKKKLLAFPGLPPGLLHPPPGCLFHPRCPYVMERCKTEKPELRTVAPERQVACHLR